MRKSTVLLILLALLCGAVAVGMERRGKIARNLQNRDGVDVFDSFMLQAPEFLHGTKAYIDDAFPLPPFAMMLITPYSGFSRPNAQLAWVLSKVLFVTVIFLALRAVVRRGGGDIAPWALVLIFIAWTNPIMGDVQEGQMNLLMLLPLSLSLLAAQNQTRRGDILAGLLLAMAICIKVTPLAFVPYFLWRRRWRVALWTLAGIPVWLVIVPCLFFGRMQNIVWLIQWVDVMIAPYVLHSQIKYASGESIPEFLARYLSHATAWTNKDALGFPVNHYVNIVNLPQNLVHRISRAILLSLGIFGLWWMRRPLPTLRCRRYIMEIACVGLFMLWSSERTWVHHYVTLLPALLATGMLAGDPLLSAASRRRAQIGLVIAAVLIPFTSDLGRVFGHEGRRYVESLNFVFFASLALALAIVLARYRPGAESTGLQPALAAR